MLLATDRSRRQANTWTTEPKPFPVDKWSGGVASNGFYDPVLNVHVYHLAGDSRDNGTIWTYRHKRAKPR